MKRILCLPGFLQSGKMLSEKASGLRKALEKESFALDFVDPQMVLLNKEDVPFSLGATPSEIESKWAQIVENNTNRCWWNHTDRGYEGFDDAVAWVAEHIRKNGPYDGVLGFSQGAALAAVVASSVGRLVPENGPFAFAVVFLGFAFTEVVGGGDKSTVNSTVTDLDEYKKKVRVLEGYEGWFGGVSTHVVNVYGANDYAVPAIRSRYLGTLFERVSEIEHDGGHFIPNKKPFVEEVLEKVGIGAKGGRFEKNGERSKI